MLNGGQELYADSAAPENFCDEAGKATCEYVFALAHGTGNDGGLFYHGGAIRKPGLAICSCNNGLAPVISRIERTDRQSVINDTTVT